MTETFPRENETISVPNFEMEEAREVIRQLIEKGERPVVTVPLKYKEELKHGLVPHSTWIAEQELICGTLGRDPYLPQDEERVIVSIDVLPEQIEPRATGPDHHWHGVVVLHGPIAPQSLHF